MPKIRLYDYQQDMLDQIVANFADHRSVMAQMPTGTGKTCLLASFVLRYMVQYDSAVWIIAHRRELVEQIESTLLRYGIEPRNGRTKVLSIQWLIRHIGEINEIPGLIVIDEAHHALAESYQMLWDRYPDALKLGMTATPYRLNRKGFTDLFEVLIQSWGIAEFIEQGRLSLFDYVGISPGSRAQGIIDGLKKRGADGDFQVKEMNDALNRRQNIELLYESIVDYAPGKKGIVYAINIDHAHAIADLYKSKGLNSKAIDCHTPADERCRLVEDFRNGNLDVLVNVDVFSEGFDCPDVEFVQMARPTLSLAKYLQQVGRGLRVAKGKKSCILIDNVGLYRQFGLPTYPHDWQATFEGRFFRKHGKSAFETRMPAPLTFSMGYEAPDVHGSSEMMVVVTHDSLLESIRNDRLKRRAITVSHPLKRFKDEVSGLFGLKKGKNIICKPRFAKVLELNGDYAKVAYENWFTSVVDASGENVVPPNKYSELRFLDNDLLLTCKKKGEYTYIDLRNRQRFEAFWGERPPKILRYGTVELVRTEYVYSSRTDEPFTVSSAIGHENIRWLGFYLSIFDIRKDAINEACRKYGELQEKNGTYVCLVEHDSSQAYRLSAILSDYSIVVMDKDQRYYRITKDGTRQYLCRNEADEVVDSPDYVIPRLLDK